MGGILNHVTRLLSVVNYDSQCSMRHREWEHDQRGGVWAPLIGNNCSIMPLIRTKDHSKYDNQQRMKIHMGRVKQSFSFGYRHWSKTKGYELSGGASDPNNCLTMLLIETKGGDKYDDEGLIRCSNYKNGTTGLYELGCIGAVILIVRLIWIILM